MDKSLSATSRRSGAVTASDDTLASNNGFAATLPWGGSYDIGLDSLRFQSNNFSSTYNPQLRSSFSARVTQPLFRNFKIDGIRQQFPNTPVLGRSLYRKIGFQNARITQIEENLGRVQAD